MRSSPPSASAALCNSSIERVSTASGDPPCAKARVAAAASGATNRSFPRWRRDKVGRELVVMGRCSRRWSRHEMFRHARGGELSVEGLAGQKVFELAARLQQRVEANAGVEAHRLQHEHQIFGGDVAARAGRVRATAETAERSIERTNAGVERGD